MSARHHISQRIRRSGAAALLVAAGAPIAGLSSVLPVRAGSATLVISEFRLRGPSGATDEFIEIQNISTADITVAASGSGTGAAVAASDGIVRCVIPNGTVIPRYGHFLCVGNTYGLTGYPAADDLLNTATADAPAFTADIADNVGIALFDTDVSANFDLAHRLDAVGSTAESNALYREGAGYPAITPFSIDASFYRNLSTAQVNAAAIDTITPGLSEDTDDNAADFVFVDTNGTSAGAGQRLGAPGPENLSSPVVNGGLAVSLLDTCADANSAPNAVYDATSNPSQNSTFGTVEFRRTFTNNTGGSVTRLRIRVADQRTFPAASGFADMRDRSSVSSVVTVDRAPCSSGTSNITVNATTLEEPPTSPNGSAFNSSLSADIVTLASPLAAGQSVDVAMLFGLQQTGNVSANFVVEAITTGAVTAPTLNCLGATSAAVLSNYCGGNAPVAVGNEYAVANSGELQIAAPGLLANDTDPEGQLIAVNVASATEPTHGTLALNANGSFIYTPFSGYSGPDSFTYRITDGTSESANATVTLTVGANQPPVANADTYSTAEDSPLVVPVITGVLANDTDAETDSLRAFLVTQPEHGTVTIGLEGSFTYNPGENFFGTDSFTYKAAQGDGTNAAATVTITVTPVNDAPVAQPDEGSTLQDGSLTSPTPGPLANDRDADGDPLTAILLTPPLHGTVVLAADGSYVYTPEPGFVGTDSFTYAASDGVVASLGVTVMLTIADPTLSAPTSVPTSGPSGATTGATVPSTGGNLQVTAAVASGLLLLGGLLMFGRRRQPRARRAE